MSIRHLDSLYKPRSLAVIGASRRDDSLGAVLAANLMSSGFKGPIYPIHPKAKEIGDRVAYPSVAALPEAPDLAVIATPPQTVPDLIAQLAARGTRGAVVITAGFGEGGDQEGQQRRQDMLDAAKTNTLRIIGPNCLGVIVPGVGLNASFSHISALPGDLAFVTQSGAMVTAMLDWATPRGIGFSHVVSLGDKSDVDFGDMLDYLAMDFNTRAILLYVESISHSRKFMSAARAAARSKPVIVIKGGRYAEGAKAAASHTGALAGSDAVYDAVFARAGLLRVFSLEELFDAAETLATARKVRGDRLAIATNGGGLGVLATDALIEEGGRLAALSEETLKGLNAVLPATWSHGNPVDIIGDAPGTRYAATLEVLLKDPGADAVLVMNCPTAVASSLEAAQSVVASVEQHTSQQGSSRAKPVFTAWVGDKAAREGRQVFSEKHLPTYDTPEQAVRGFMHLVRYRRNQDLLSETPSSIATTDKAGEAATDWAAAHSIIVAALEEKREWLSEPEAKAVLAAYGIPVVETFQVDSPEAAALAAGRIKGPVVLKILSPDLTHKSDVGGVELGLNGPEEVFNAAREMNARVKRLAPSAELAGFAVQPLCKRPHAQELILGAATDAQFGPVILFGAGGTAVEVLGDKSIGLPPLNSTLARDLISSTRIFKLLQGYRDRAPADLDALTAALIRLSDLVVDFAEIAEIDINPLLADADGVIALDARVRVCPKSARAIERLAIRPYPQELEQNFALRDGTDIFLRPIRPEDEPLLQRMFDRLSPEDIRLRFFAALTELSHSFAARLTQIDYHREMAFVALKEGGEGQDSEIWGVVRISADPDNERAEYAVLVRSDLKGLGLGAELMNRILDYAVSRGLSEIWGDVLEHNKRMLELARELGFTTRHLPDEPGIVRVVKRLDTID